MTLPRLVERLVELASGRAARVTCSVAGESGSGKTTLACQLVAELAARDRSAVVLSQDDYFVLPPRKNAARRVAEPAWVGRGEVQLDRIAEHLAAFVAGAEGIGKPRLDRAADRFVTEQLDLRAVQLLIVEGTYVTGLQPLDLRVFIEGDYRQTEQARRARGRDPIDSRTDAILAAEHRIIRQDRTLADVVLPAWSTAGDTRRPQ